MPMLLFGLESIFILKKHLKLLSDFHMDTLRKLQALPSRTSNAAVLLLLGALPLEAELDKKKKKKKKKKTFEPVVFMCQIW